MAGTGEVIFSDVTVTTEWRGCGLGRSWYWPVDLPASFPGGVRDNEEFYRAKKSHARGQGVLPSGCLPLSGIAGIAHIIR
jgi:hypothetical protein